MATIPGAAVPGAPVPGAAVPGVSVAPRTSGPVNDVPPSRGVTGWDLLSTLQSQAEYAQYYKAQPPVACPNDGTPLKPSPSGATGQLYCPFDGFSYPDDYDPDTMAGM